MIRFRPLLVPTVATAIMLPILIGLGTWQVERLHWKEALLTSIDHSLQAKPLPIDEPRILNLEGIRPPYMRVSARGYFDHAKEAYLFASDTRGNPGYHVITPLHASNGMVFLVDRGYVPREKLSPATRPDGQVRGEQNIVGLLRSEEHPGLFTPAADVAHRIWYVRDAEAIAKADGVFDADLGTVLIDADAAPNPGGWPKGGQTIIDIPNNHLSYALTWFGLALVLLGIYMAYHITQGRLSLRN